MRMLTSIACGLVKCNHESEGESSAGKTPKKMWKVASPEGESFCIQFRYERLPVFCFRCGVMGHDE